MFDNTCANKNVDLNVVHVFTTVLELKSTRHLCLKGAHLVHNALQDIVCTLWWMYCVEKKIFHNVYCNDDNGVFGIQPQGSIQKIPI